MKNRFFFFIFAFVLFSAGTACAAEKIKVLPAPSDPAAPYKAYYKARIPDAFARTDRHAYPDWLPDLIRKQKNANLMIERGFSMPFKVSDINEENEKLLKAFAKKTPEAEREITDIYFRLMQCYPQKDRCLEKIPNDITKYLSLNEREKQEYALQKTYALIPRPENPDDTEMMRVYYDLILLKKLKQRASNALDRAASHTFDDSVTYLTLTAAEAEKRHNEDYDDYVPAVNLNSSLEKYIERHSNRKESLIPAVSPEPVKAVLSAMPMTAPVSALCLKIKQDKPYENLEKNIVYKDMEGNQYEFSFNNDRMIEEQPYYFVTINKKRKNDRLSERYLPSYPSPVGFFEYQGSLFLAAFRDKAQYKIFKFDPEAYFFEPVCILSADMTDFNVKAREPDAPLCRKVIRKEYDVYPEKPLTQKMTADGMKKLFASQCGEKDAAAQEKCINDKMYNFRDAAGVFADYNNDGKEDVLLDARTLHACNPETGKTVPIIKGLEETTDGMKNADGYFIAENGKQHIIRIDGSNYLLTTNDYQWDDLKKSIYDYANDWRTAPENLYRITVMPDGTDKAVHVCTFTPSGNYY